MDRDELAETLALYHLLSAPDMMAAATVDEEVRAMRKDAPWNPKGPFLKRAPRIVGEIGALIEEGETVVKDGLRGARHVFRQGALRGASGDPVSRRITNVARTMDGVLTRAEQVARSVMRPGASPRSPASLLVRFPDLLRENEADLRQGLIETEYQLAKAVLVQWGAEDALILEQAIRSGAQRFVSEERALLDAAQNAIREGDAEARMGAICDVAASIALILAEEEPVRALGRSVQGSARLAEGAERSTPAFLRHGASLPTFLAVGLAVCGYAGRRSASSAAEDFVPSAAAIVEGRFERLSQCRTAFELSAAYRMLVPAMP
ncbi:MAG: hypothetical protein H7Y08_09810 [Rhizobiaceae bacterium]|nr:hypothetical protein [Rhizobiaceae bacterium]